VQDVEITAVSSRNRARAENRANEFGIASFYTDYRAMLDKEEPDFVDIATPPDSHREIIEESAVRGVDILCQKPIAASLQELDDIISQCARSDVRFMVNENGRFQPWFREIKRYISDGLLGSPFYAGFMARLRTSLPKPHFNREFFADMPRFIIYELGVHYLDTLRYLFGEPQELFCTARRISAQIKGEETAVIQLRFPFLTAVVDMSWASVPIFGATKRISWGEYQIEGTAGTILVGIDGKMSIAGDDFQKEILYPDDSIVLGYRGALEHFAHCIRSGQEFETSGPETYKTMELVFGSYLSSETGKAYRIGTDLAKLT
jgi:predicted dehydrogenase